MGSGEVEVLASTYQVLNQARPDIPFLIRDHNKVSKVFALENLKIPAAVFMTTTGNFDFY